MLDEINVYGEGVLSFAIRVYRLGCRAYSIDLGLSPRATSSGFRVQNLENFFANASGTEKTPRAIQPRK